MSKNETNASKHIVIPYVAIERVIELSKLMYKNSAKEKKLTELASILGCTVSNLNNVTPTFSVLGLGEVKRGTMTLTPDGLVFADYCMHDDYEKAKQIIKKNIQNSEVMMFIKSLLESRSSLSGDEVGRALSERFSKNWKDIRTTKNFGNSCSSIISFAGFGYYSDGVLSLKPHVLKSTTKLYPPSVGYNSMLDILKTLHGFERATVSDIAKRLQVNETALYSNIIVCTILRLVEKETANKFILTDSGRQLIDPTISQEHKTEIFRKCLFISPYVDIVKKLEQSGKEMTYGEIGDVISFFMQTHWSDDTKLNFGKKFGTWLNNAGLTEKVKPGMYKIKTDVMEKIDIEEIKTEVQNEQKSQININSIYEIGRAIGNIESVMFQGEKSSFFGERIAFLKELLSNHEDLKLTLDMLAKNFEMTVNSNNSSIYESNVDFIREKIKEKIVPEGVA